jgi:hypothetical protein
MKLARTKQETNETGREKQFLCNTFGQCCGSGSGAFYPLDPGSGMNFFRIRDHLLVYQYIFEKKCLISAQLLGECQKKVLKSKMPQYLVKHYTMLP